MLENEIKSTEADWNHIVNRCIYPTKEILVYFEGKGKIYFYYFIIKNILLLMDWSRKHSPGRWYRAIGKK